MARIPTLATLLGATTCLLGLTGSTPAIAATTSLRAVGTQLQLTLPDGRRLTSEHLVGAQLHTPHADALRIDAVETTLDPNGRMLWLHTLSARSADGRWEPACAPHSDGTSYALFVPGRQRDDGSVDEDESAYAISCTSGALAKCLRAGYRPWEPQQRGLYNACIRMFRADYGGEGRPYTENGRLIDMYDPQGIQRPDMLPTQTFEAGWDEHGAVCVHHPRVAANVTLAELEQRYPRLRGRVGAVCTEAFARDAGARIFNRSNEP